MKFKLQFPLKSFLLFTVLGFVLNSVPFASAADLSPNQRASIDWEQKFNKMGKNRTQFVKLEHFEIPLENLEKEIAISRIPSPIYSDLIFKKSMDGIEKEYVRWIINPEDTKYALEVEAYLKSKSLDSTRYKYFDAFQTASRSWYCIGPQSNMMFSMKVSTNNTGGGWKNKGQSYRDAVDIRGISDFVIKAISENPPQNFKFLDEPAAFGIKELDQGMVVRLLGDISTPHSTFRYLPAFSAFHEEEGKRIALKNGADPTAVNGISEYWNQHLNIPLARALAELFVMTGITLESPHGQNFLIELDANEVPTGKIILKDLGDAILSRLHFEATGNQKILETFSNRKNIFPKKTPVLFGLLHGNVPPPWIGQKDVNLYAQNFFLEFQKTVQHMTKIPMEDIMGNSKIYSNINLYDVSYIKMDSPGFSKFLEKLKAMSLYNRNKF